MPVLGAVAGAIEVLSQLPSPAPVPAVHEVQHSGRST